MTEEFELLPDIVHSQSGAQRNAFRCDDITQFSSLCPFDFYEAFFDKAFNMPINRPDRHTQFFCQLRLGKRPGQPRFPVKSARSR